jgi:hypothetical protein
MENADLISTNGYLKTSVITMSQNGDMIQDLLHWHGKQQFKLSTNEP